MVIVIQKYVIDLNARLNPDIKRTKIMTKCRHNWRELVDNEFPTCWEWCKNCGSLRRFQSNNTGYTYRWPFNKKLQTEAIEPCTLQCVAPSKDCCDFESVGCQWPR